jgi:hypothetical protein
LPDGPPAHLDVARSFAPRQSRPSPGLPFLFGGLVLMGQLLSGPTGWRLWLFLVAVACWVVAVPLIVRQHRRTRRFLAEHPAEDG